MIENMSEMLSTTSSDGQRRGQVAAQFVRVVKDRHLFAMPDYVSLIGKDRDVAVTVTGVCDESQAVVKDRCHGDVIIPTTM